MSGRHADEPGILWHYTDAAGLVGIFADLSPTLWATSAVLLNDAQELRFGAAQAIDAIDDEIARIKDDQQHSRWVPTVLEGQRGHLKNYFALEEQMSPRVAYAPFVTCFSEHDDDLSQWRGYGDLGYAIGFFSDMVEKTVSAPGVDYDDLGTRLQKVRYGDHARTLLDQRVREVATASASHPPAGFSGVHDHALFVQTFAHDLPVCKHPAFKNELEWRIITGGAGREINFRATKMGPTPYVTFNLPAAAVAKIRVGPGPDSGARNAAVVHLMDQVAKKNNLTFGIHVERSEVPFRPMKT